MEHVQPNDQDNQHQMQSDQLKSLAAAQFWRAASHDLPQSPFHLLLASQIFRDSSGTSLVELMRDLGLWQFVFTFGADMQVLTCFKFFLVADSFKSAFCARKGV